MKSDLGGERRVIDGFSFDVGYLNTKQARKTWTKLMQNLGPSVAHAQDAQLDRAFDALANRPDLADFFEELVSIMAVVTLVDNKPLTQCESDVFKGRIGLTFKWLKFALEVNFKDFLDMLGDLMAAAPVETPSK